MAPNLMIYDSIVNKLSAKAILNASLGFVCIRLPDFCLCRPEERCGCFSLVIFHSTSVTLFQIVVHWKDKTIPTSSGGSAFDA